VVGAGVVVVERVGGTVVLTVEEDDDVPLLLAELRDRTAGIVAM
jgi:hypothetical protein